MENPFTCLYSFYNLCYYYSEYFCVQAEACKTEMQTLRSTEGLFVWFVQLFSSLFISTQYYSRIICTRGTEECLLFRCVRVGGVWEDSAHPHASSHSLLNLQPFFQEQFPSLVFSTYFLWAQAHSLSLSRKRYQSVYFTGSSLCLPGDALQIFGFMGVSRAGWLWNSIGLLLQNTGNQAKACSGLWWQKGKSQEQAREGVGSEEWGTK